jgi:2-polyprenyl-3-methyl-5-hydroxy-6-metoxy-1,4-benzoquinol methylase
MKSLKKDIYKSRDCPVCNSFLKQELFIQSFETFSAGSLLRGYKLVLCEHCGMAFADKIPGQEEFDKYYSAMSKYEEGHRGGNVRNEDADIYRQIVDLLLGHISLNSSIADVGCASGGLLAEFKKRGFYKLTGFDPSEKCCKIGKELHGLGMKHSTINQLSRENERYDVVIITGVLEHLRDIDGSIKSLKTILKKDGKLFVAVPDASYYHKHFGAPFQYFSMEHINYFAPISLNNLMLKHGFTKSFIKRYDRKLGPNSIEPVIMGLFSSCQDAAESENISYDCETRDGVAHYIENSKNLETKINKRIRDLVEGKAPLLVWASGTHTLRLLKTSSLAEANIVAFIDSNKNYQGKTINNKPVLDADECENIDAEILISSQVAEDEIKKYIELDLKWNKKIHTLYGS